jgi:hypothetical protein
MDQKKSILIQEIGIDSQDRLGIKYPNILTKIFPKEHKF